MLRLDGLLEAQLLEVTDGLVSIGIGRLIIQPLTMVKVEVSVALHKIHVVHLLDEAHQVWVQDGQRNRLLVVQQFPEPIHQT